MRSRTLTLLTCAAALTSAATAQTPILLKDINPTGASEAMFFTCFQNETYFQATDGEHGRELWKTDGTEAGTVMVKDMLPGSGAGAPRYFAEMNGLLYFTATDGVNDVQLWRTDGTESGTQVALNLADVDGLLEWTDLVALPGAVPEQDRIFFRGRSLLVGGALWYTDGTAAGTQLFIDIYPGPATSVISELMAYGGKLYFKGSDGTNGNEPWVSDGTWAGTHMIEDVIPGGAGCDPIDFTGVGDLVFFRASLPSTGGELWATDGTEPGTYMVKDLRPGPNGGLPAFLAEHNGLLYCRAYDTATDIFIWESDGTTDGTIVLPEPTPGYDAPEQFCSHDGWLYFTAVGEGYRQIWRTNGTAASAQEITYPGSDNLTALSNFIPMVSCGGDLIYRAKYMAATDVEPYVLNVSTGSEEHTAERMQLYPNPVTDRFVVQMTKPTNAQLLDNSGRVVRSWRFAAGANTVDLAGLASGAYVLMTEAGAQNVVKY